MKDEDKKELERMLAKQVEIGIQKWMDKKHSEIQRMVGKWTLSKIWNVFLYVFTVLLAYLYLASGAWKKWIVEHENGTKEIAVESPR